MNSCITALGRLSAILSLCLLGAAGASAQTATTGSLAGIVTDAQKGVLPGATVIATHTPTGTTYETVTDADGRFNILNMRVGPYTVSAVLSGFRKDEQTDVPVTLGEQRSVEFSLRIESIAETVEVIAQSSIIDSSRAGTADNISSQAVQSLPTISRNIVDIARTSPYFNPAGLNEDPLALSVAGRNNRYNNLQIDGAVNNDVFGLAPSGTPGGTTEAQPISLDAVQELQLVVSPYDVRQGGFSGGGINAITKSGSNALKGTAYFFGRNQDWVGEAPNGTKIGQFKDQQFGGSVGGPIVQNKAFFFGNVDWTQKDNPSGFSVNGSGQQFGRSAEIDRFISILRTRYNYSPGGTEEFIRTIDSNKFFVRGDFNLNQRNQLTVRHNYLDAKNDIGRPTTALYYMPDNFYRMNNKTNSTVGQLNSTLGTAVNELRFTYQRIRDRRGAGPSEERPFPFILVDLSAGQARAGRENFSTANELDQDVYELTDDFTLLRGRHTFTFGTHNEFFRFRNLFIRDSFGSYRFANLDMLEQGLAQQYDYSFSLTSDPLQSAKFRVRQFGFYAGDQWRAAHQPDVDLRRACGHPDVPGQADRKPVVGEHVSATATDEVPGGVLWSPRVGFNYALSENNTEQVRGGIGLFSGRTPYVWLSNQYGNTGIEFRRLAVGFNATQPDHVRARSGGTADLGRQRRDQRSGPDRSRLQVSVARAVQSRLRSRPEGVRAHRDGRVPLFAERQRREAIENLNLQQVGTRIDGRPFYARNREYVDLGCDLPDQHRPG